MLPIVLQMDEIETTDGTKQCFPWFFKGMRMKLLMAQSNTPHGFSKGRRNNLLVVTSNASHGSSKG